MEVKGTCKVLKGMRSVVETSSMLIGGVCERGKVREFSRGKVGSISVFALEDCKIKDKQKPWK